MKSNSLFWKIRDGKNHFLLVILTIVIAWYISENFYQLMMILGNSMLPTYHNMQIVLLDKHSEIYTYGDVIAFQCNSLNEILVKRVVACPNDTVVIKNGTLYVNGMVSDVFSKENSFDYSGIAESVSYLESNQYFVIGDNIIQSKDSRYIEIGYVCEENIRGKVVDLGINFKKLR